MGDPLGMGVTLFWGPLGTFRGSLNTLNPPQNTPPAPHLELGVLGGHWDELGQAVAEPEGDGALHVDGEGLVALLQAADAKVAQGAHVLAQVQVPLLPQTQAAHGDKAWGARGGSAV